MILTLFTTIFGVTFLYYVAKYAWKWYILWKARDPMSPYGELPIPPGDFGLPIIGETHLWALQGSQFNSIRRKKYGKAFSTNFIGRTMVKVTGPEYVKQILTANHNIVATIWPATVQKVLGDSAIANSVGNIHKFRRNAFLKAFTREALNEYVLIIQESVREKLHSWSTNIDRMQLVYSELKFLSFNIAFRVLVGLSFRNDIEEMELFKTFDSMIQNLFSLPYNLPGSGFRKALNAKKVIHEILDDHVRKVRQQIEESTKHGLAQKGDEQRHNVLKIVLEAQTKNQERHKDDSKILNSDDRGDQTVKNPSTECEDEDGLEMSDADLKETTVEMLFAGYMTTASIATSAIINLISHPEVFRKLEDELRHFGFLKDQNSSSDSNSHDDVTLAAIKRVVAGNGHVPLTRHRRGDPDLFNNNSPKCFLKQKKENVLTVDMLSKLTYLEQFFKETLRIMPPILGGYRLALKTFQLGEFRVPKGWTIVYNIRDTHESEWEEDVEFNPDRFSPDNWKDNKESRYRWIPFGGGSRTCVGKEFARLQFKIFIIELIRHFSKIEFAKGKPPKMFAVPFLHPTDGLPVKLTRRNFEETSIQT